MRNFDENHIINSSYLHTYFKLTTIKQTVIKKRASWLAFTHQDRKVQILSISTMIDTDSFK